jgi:hypothetical protein
MKYLINAKVLFILLIVSSFSIHGCTFRYVADYDASIKEEIIRVAKEVDLFWGALLDVDASERKYDKFKDQYNQIETDIRGLVMKNEIRALNKESTKQAKIALELWIEDRDIHKQNNAFSDFEAKRHREQYTRIFTAMAKGEEAKNISTKNSSSKTKGDNK